MHKVTFAHLALLLANILWGLNYPFDKLVIPHYISPLAMASLAIFAAAILSQLADMPKHRERVDRGDILPLIVAGLLMSFCRKFFLLKGISMTTPIDASIITTMTPIIVLSLSLITRKEHFTPLKVSGMFVGFLGAVLLILFSTKSEATMKSQINGDVLVFICALSTSLYIVLFKDLIVKYRPLTLLRWLYGTSAIVILPFTFKAVVSVDYGALLHSAPLPFLYILLVPAFIPNLILANGLKYVTPSVSSMYNYLQPVVAAVGALIIGVDKLRWQSVVAAIVIFVAVGMVRRSDSPHN